MWFQAVGEVRHVGQEHQHALALQREPLGDRQGNVRHEDALDDGVRGGVHEEDRSRQGTALLQGVPEVEVVVVLQTDAAEDDEIDLGLHGDPCQQRIVGLTGDAEYGQLLGLHEAVEDIDHRDVRPDHILRDDPPRGVDRRTGDLDEVLLQGGAVVPRGSTSVKDAPHQVLGEGYLHGMPEEDDLVAGGHAASAGEDLQRNLVAIELNDLGQTRAVCRLDLGEMPVSDAGCGHRNDVSGNGFDLAIDFLHRLSPRLRVRFLEQVLCVVLDADRFLLDHLPDLVFQRLEVV